MVIIFLSLQKRKLTEMLNNLLISGGDRNQTSVSQILEPVALLIRNSPSRSPDFLFLSIHKQRF